MRLAVFDLDGTLIDSLPDLADSLNLLLASYGLPTESETSVRGLIGDGVAALVARGLQRAGTPAASIDRAAATQRFMEIYTPRATRESRLFPGTLEALDHLQAEGWHLAVCTNKPVAAARKILETFDIAGRLSALGGGDSFPTRKPDPGALLGTIRLAGGDPGDAVMTGDHANDIHAATGAGVKSIFAEWGYSSATGATACAARITDVPAIADRLLARPAAATS